MLTLILFIISSVLTFVMNLLDSLPTLSISIPFTVFDVFQDIFYSINFFLPMNTIIAIFEIKLSLIAFRIAYSIILRIKSFIPTLGGD